MKRFCGYLLTLLFLLIIQACAQMKTPTGGDKDETSPQLTYSAPQLLSTNFAGDKIVLEFDEYVQLANVRDQVIISPPLDKAPDFELKGGNKVIITFNDTLQANTTYTMNFGEAISDYNEGNILSENLFLFSTGDFIDSLSVAGTLFLAENDEACASCLVMLYKNLIDSAFFKSKPYYISKSNETGGFRIPYLSGGTYNLVGLMDMDADLKYDRGEQLAFLNQPIEVSEGDSVLHELRMFREIEEELFVKNIDVGAFKQSIVVSFSKDVKDLNLKALADSPLPAETIDFDRKDSVEFWFSPHVDDKAIALELLDSEMVIDTINVRTEKRKTDIGPLSIRETVLPHNEATLPIKLDRPVKSMDVGLMELIKDSLEVEFSIEQSGPKELALSAAWEENGVYTMSILPGAFEPLVGPTNDSTSFDFKCPALESLGTVIVSIIDSSYANCVLTLRSPDKKGQLPVHQKTVTDTGVYTFSNIKPASYSLYILYDENENGKWDTGDYLNGTQPERVVKYGENIQLKGNWEIEVILD